MTEALLVRLGATSEQIELERDRIRSELFRGASHSETPAGPARQPEDLAVRRSRSHGEG